MVKQIVEYNGYDFKEYSIRDIDDFYQLFLSVHGPISTKEYFISKSDTGFAGEQIIGYLAYHRLTNEVAAFYAVYPLKMNFGNKELLCAQSGDTLTHPNHRRKGLFEKLFVLTKEKCKELSVKFIFGFPNSNSSPGFKKFGWAFYPTVVNLNLLYRRNYFERLRDKLFPFYYSYTINKLKISYLGIDAKGFQSDIVRSKEYIEYKARLSNLKFYNLSSCIIWAKMDKNSFYLGDIKLKPNVTFSDAAQDLLKFFKSLSFWNFYYSSDKSNQLISELKKTLMFTITESDCIVYKLDTTIDINQIRFSLVDFDTF